jgi:hypothetical protein
MIIPDWIRKTEVVSGVTAHGESTVTTWDSIA